MKGNRLHLVYGPTLGSWLLSGMPLDSVGPVWQTFEVVLLTEIFKFLSIFKARKPKGEYYPI